jgi:membrane associated rhomboid family serine protease
MGVYTAIALQQGAEWQRLVGASAAIMGLLGVIVAILLRGWWQEGSAIARQRLQLFLGIIAVQVIVDGLIPEVSGLAHALGLIWGITLGMILSVGSDYRS